MISLMTVTLPNTLPHREAVVLDMMTDILKKVAEDAKSDKV
jgi:hypothetical protein